MMMIWRRKYEGTGPTMKKEKDDDSDNIDDGENNTVIN